MSDAAANTGILRTTIVWWVETAMPPEHRIIATKHDDDRLVDELLIQGPSMPPPGHDGQPQLVRMRVSTHVDSETWELTRTARWDHCPEIEWSVPPLR
jgi:hypothetical protein